MRDEQTLLRTRAKLETALETFKSEFPTQRIDLPTSSLTLCLRSARQSRIRAEIANPHQSPSEPIGENTAPPGWLDLLDLVPASSPKLCGSSEVTEFLLKLLPEESKLGVVNLIRRVPKVAGKRLKVAHDDTTIKCSLNARRIPRLRKNAKVWEGETLDGDKVVLVLANPPA